MQETGAASRGFKTSLCAPAAAQQSQGQSSACQALPEQDQWQHRDVFTQPGHTRQFPYNQSPIKNKKHEGAPRVAEPSSIECVLLIPGRLHPWDFQSLLEAPGNSAAVPQFHQVTHTSSPLDFISSLLSHANVTLPRCCGSRSSSGISCCCWKE